jgi:hypothetical protein
MTTSVPEIVESFEVAYYRFGREEWQRELASDLAGLRRLGGTYGRWVSAVFDGIEAGAREDLANGLLHRGHPSAVRRLGVELRPAEAEMLDRWDQGLLADSGPAKAPLTRARINRARIAKEIRRALDGLGPAEEMDSALVWRHTTEHGDFTVRTYVDLGGRVWHLGYHHSLHLGDVRIWRSASFLGWLGIGQTKWLLESQQEGLQAAQLLSEFCQRFFESLPKLLSE